MTRFSMSLRYTATHSIMSDFPVIENPAKLKVVELKEELDKRGLPLGGLKKDVSNLVTLRNNSSFARTRADMQLVARLEESQGLIQPPTPDEARYEPDPALPESKPIGKDEDHAKPAETMLDLAVPPHEISDTNGPAIREDVIDPEVAAAHHPDQAAPPPPPPLHSEEAKEEEGVGHVMVEGESAITEADTEVQASIQPAALDSEVAKVVAEEEMKDLDPTIEPTTSVGMEKQLSDSRVHTPDLDQDEDVLDLGEEVETKKRQRDDEISKAPKRPKRQFRSLPSELKHLIHPPTTCLYISNLRRPLLLPALHEYVTPSEQQSPLLPPPKAPFSNPEYPNTWLSGIKSHAYAVYDTVESAVEAAIRIDGKIFPEDTGGELKVDFVDEDEITRLVQREEAAWLNGRQKLELKITETDEGDGTGYKFDFSGGSSNGSSNGRPMNGRNAPPPPGRRAPVAVPLTGINATPVGNRYPEGPGGRQGEGSRLPSGPGGSGGPRDGQGGRGIIGAGQGRDGRGLPPHLDQRGGGFRGNDFRPGPGGFSDRGGGSGEGSGEGGGGFRNGPGDGERRTKVKPELSWKEGPRAR